ncbi:hypothetical protein A0H81_11166 [Grifola frondosa]|uniref:Uncharacterized protein n=1 Tax=Grifola frondosa TaxID=5627 RepID=A0A1C7LXC0_GRIFR|nr:hypothetical protein A0H81_11166 [Grifola frondosa]
MQRPACADSVKTSDGATSRSPEATPIEAPGAPRMHFTPEIAQPRVVRPLPRVPPPPPLSFGAPRRTEASTFADEVMNAWSRLKSVMDRDPREQSRTFSRK